MAASSNLERRLRAQLDRLDAEGLRRSLRVPSGIDLSSNDYLGLSTHPLLRDAMAEAVAREGCGSTGSRLLRGERDVFTHLERRFARFKGAERALYFSSGYLANIAILTTFTQPGDVIYSDQHNHASLIDGARLSKAQRRIFPHHDVAALEALLREETAPGQKFVVTESVFSMDGDIAPLAEYSRLASVHGASLIVDDAHAVGIFGPNGEGLSGDAWISVSTAGKALGVCGAFVAGPEWAIEHLIQRARPFIFSTAAPPPVAAALEASLTVIEREPWRRAQVLVRAAYLRRRLAERGIEVPEGVSQIIPLVIGDNQRAMLVAQALEERGFDARAIRPPSVPEGTARLRLAINANLSEVTLDRFVDALAGALKEYAACCAASS
jgi:8-amino-7-oxononanoate synthase